MQAAAGCISNRGGDGRVRGVVYLCLYSAAGSVVASISRELLLFSVRDSKSQIHGELGGTEEEKRWRQ
jgi:hypothetical protein